MKNIFLIDLDETLLDFTRTERENLLRTLTSFGIDPDEDFIHRFHVINDGLWKALERGETTRDELIVKRFEILFSERGIDAPAESVSKAFFEGYAEICFPYEGAAEFLHTLSERGRVYIVTNGAAFIQERHVKDAGFSPYLSGLFISENIGYPKPDVRFAQYAARRIEGFEKECAVWLGDSLTSDCLCARRAGIDFVLFAQHAPDGYSGKVARNYAEAIVAFGL